MYDELVKRLRAQAVYLPEKFSKNAELLDALMKAADAIEELIAVCKKQEIELVELTGELASKPCWIPVTERLPEESYDGFSDDVLMLIEEPDGDKIWRNPYVGYYLYDACSDETGWWVKMTCDCTKVGEHKHGGKIYKANEYVTHWMPLPEPPKEE